MVIDKECIECGVEYTARTLFTRYCGARCRMRAYRKTEKGKAMVKKTNERYKRPDIDKVCLHCGMRFTTTRKSKDMCDACTEKHGGYYAQKRYRAKNGDKIKKWDRVAHKARRCKEHYVAQECSIDGCDRKGHRHHPDYDKPLEIVWLCPKHHSTKRLEYTNVNSGSWDTQ